MIAIDGVKSKETLNIILPFIDKDSINDEIRKKVFNKDSLLYTYTIMSLLRSKIKTIDSITQ